MPVAIIVIIVVLVIGIRLIVKAFGAPSINSVVTIIIDTGLIAALLQWQELSDVLKGIFIVVISIALLDCLRDLMMADKYYYFDADGIAEKFFIKKSVWSFFTLSGARAVYFLFICPFIAIEARQYVKVTMKEDKLVSSFPQSFGYRDYHIQKYVTRCLAKHKIYENRSTVIANTQKSGEKIDRSKPKKFLPKVAELFTSDGRYNRRQRKYNEETNAYERQAWVYIDGDYYMKCMKTFYEFMSEQGMLSIVDIVKGLKNAHLIDDIRNKPDAEIKFFVADILDVLVYMKKLEEADVSDDVFDNRQYKHPKGKVTVSRDISSLMDDDDD